MVEAKVSILSIQNLRAAVVVFSFLISGGTLVAAEKKTDGQTLRGTAGGTTSSLQQQDGDSVIKIVLRSPKKLFDKIFRKEPWIGCSLPPSVNASASVSAIVRPCSPGSTSDSCPQSNSEVKLTAYATDPDNDTLLYTWTVTHGKVTGEGRSVTWDLSSVPSGTYTASVEVNDRDQHTANSATTVTVTDCSSCTPLPPCPNFSISCPAKLGPDGLLTFTANLAETTSTPGWYQWTVSAGEITSGQGTPSIKVDTSKVTGDTVTATIQIGAVGTHCKTVTHSCTGHVRSSQE